MGINCTHVCVKMEGVDEVTYRQCIKWDESWGMPTVIHFACTFSRSHINFLRNIVITNSSLILQIFTLCLTSNNTSLYIHIEEKNKPLIIQIVSWIMLWTWGKYYGLPAFVMNMSYLQVLEASCFLRGQSCFYLLGNPTTSCESSGMIGLGLYFLALTLEPTLFSIPPRLVGWMKLCKCRGPISSWLMFFSFFPRMWMVSWKGMFGRPEMVLLCCEKRFKAIIVVWWLFRIRYLTGQEIHG